MQHVTSDCRNAPCVTVTVASEVILGKRELQTNSLEMQSDIEFSLRPTLLSS